MRTQSLEFLATLIETASPTGYEHSVGAIYGDYVGAFAASVRRDVMGNVIAVLNEDAPMKVLLAGHMDEISFIVHHIDEQGFLYFSPVGSHDSVVGVGQRVWVHGEEKTAGVVGRKPIHLMEQEELAQKPAFRDLWIDIGARSKEEATSSVSVGNVVTFQQGFQRLKGDFAVARAFDNKAGLFVVAETLRLLKQQRRLHPQVGVYSVATAQEEIGSRGASTAAFQVAAHTSITVDMGHARDVPGISLEQHGRLDAGMGPGIGAGANVNRTVFNLLVSAARASGVPYQVTAVAGTSPTDAQALQVSRGGTAAGLLEVPLRYMHTPSEVVCLGDISNCARLLAAYCEALTPDVEFNP